MSEREDMNTKVIEEFRANGGVVGGMFAGMPMILIGQRGATSGKEYTTPLVYTRRGDDVVIVASMGGAPKNPQWYRNMVTNPDVTVEVGTERYQARVREAKGAERDELYAAHAVVMPFFNDYAAKTDRVIPVLVLERA